MSDRQVRELARRSAQGDPRADAELDRLSLRAGRCLGIPCKERHAGCYEEGDLGIGRTICWACGRIAFWGDTNDPGLMARAMSKWAKSSRELQDLARELGPVPRRYRFR